MPEKKIKVINAGNCMMCGKPIETTDCNILDIFFCKECLKEAECKGKNTSSEGKGNE